MTSSLSTTAPSGLLEGGSIDCPCIDVSSAFVSATSCVVGNKNSITNLQTLPTELGVDIYIPGSSSGGKPTCFPLTYGSSSCTQHDLFVHPSCTSVELGPLPEFCYEQWCYVDVTACKASTELLTRTQLFGFVDTNLYYSYSTCNSSDYWSEFVSTDAVKDQFLTVTVPKIWYPAHHKIKDTNSNNGHNNNTISMSTEEMYRNDTIPWKGWVIDYLDAVVAVSDIGGFNYTHRSGGSAVVVNSSAWTGAVYDVQVGLSDLSASLFWITTERLERTSFTTPLTIDKIMLWIENPAIEKNNRKTLYHNISKVAMPFDKDLWCTLGITILLASMLRVWFTRRDGGRSEWWHKLHNDAFKKGSVYYRTKTLLYTLFDSLLASSNDAFGQSVEFEINSSTSSKILNFGFSFLILLACVGYTANLAAFLTTQAVMNGNYIRNVEDAILTSVPLCIGPVLWDDVVTRWPDADWVSNEGTTGSSIVDGLLENFDNKRCGGLVTGIDDLLMDSNMMLEFCERNLVHTSVTVLDKLVAMPATNEIVAGISYWMFEATKKGVLFETYQQQARPPEVCALSMHHKDNEVDEVLPRLTVVNFALPLIVLFVCFVISTVLQLRFHRRNLHQLSLKNTLGPLRGKKTTTTTTTTTTTMKSEEMIVTTPAADDNDQQSGQQVYNIVQPSPVLLPMEDLSSTNDSDAMLKKWREVQNYQNNLQNYQNNLQTYQNNLVELMINKNPNKEK